MLRFDNEFAINSLFHLHYEGEGEGGEGGEGGAGEGGAGGKGADETVTMTKAKYEETILKRTEQARRQQKKTLEQLEAIQENYRGSEESRAALEQEVERLRKATLTAEEIQKREAKKAKDAYESRATKAEEAARTWEGRYKDLKISGDVRDVAIQHGVLPQALPMVQSFLRPTIKLDPVKDDAGNVIGETAVVDFSDVGADGKPVQVQFTVDQTIKRMKELPDLYGHLFQGPNGGLGGTSGRPNPGGKKGGFRADMSMEEYMKQRKENPEALGL